LLSLIALIGCGGDAGSKAATTPSGDVTSGSSGATSGQSGAGVSGVLTLDPPNGSFGNVKVGVRKGVTFTVTNPPANAATSVALSGPDANQFMMASGTCFGATRPTFAPANTCTLRVMFIPTSTGAKTASLDVVGSASANLTGTGITN
jgi:hypothetical protein